MSEIGKTLKAARIEKGYTLDDLQQITKIQKRYLIAIEEEKFADLPGEFYVKAFIKQYAETVGLDSSSLTVQLASATSASSPDSETASSEEPHSRVEATRQSIQKTDRFNRFFNLLPTIIIVAVVVIILGSIYAVAWNNHRKNSSTQQIQSSSKVSVSSSSTKKAASKTTSSKTSSTTKSSSAKAKSSSKKSTAKSKSTKTKFNLTSNSGSSFVYQMKDVSEFKQVKLSIDGSKAWSEISAGGTQQWQGTLSTGEGHTVTLPSGTSQLVIQLGNSKATSLTINGKKFDFLKDNDSLTVRTITITSAE